MIVLSTTQKDKSVSELEEWFVSELEHDPLPLKDMADVITHLIESGNTELADGCASLLEGVLIDRSAVDSLLSVMMLRADVHGDDAAFRKECLSTVSEVFADRLGLLFVKNSGFSDRVGTKECLRRLGVLLSLSPGVSCTESTWGFGVVRKVDDFYEKVVIDFDKKNGHQMSMAYAGETLTVVGADHLLSMKHTRPEELARLVHEDPAGVVVMALSSIGPMSVQDLKELLVDGVVQEGEWKKFWDSARTGLKSDPLVSVPSKRSEPITLLEEIVDTREQAIKDILIERDPEVILKALGRVSKSKDMSELLRQYQEEIAGRLSYVVRAAEPGRPELTALAVMVAEELGIEQFFVTEDQIPGVSPVVRELALSLFETKRFLSAVHSMSARNMQQFVSYLMSGDSERLIGVMLDTMDQMQISVLSEALNVLAECGKASECADRLRPAFNSRSAGVALLYWACRHLEEVDEWQFVSKFSLLEQVVASLETQYSGEELKTQNQLRGLFERREWLDSAMRALDQEQRSALLVEIRDSNGWDASSKRSVMGRIIKLYPELATAAIVEDDREDEQTQGRITSWRSYRQRNEQLRKLVEEEIPSNSREIAVARSYGDLRENAEYKAAKEHQGIIHRRRGEFEQDLKEVHGVDFSGMPSNAAGVGTVIVVERPDGSEQEYSILGEWDRDEELGIISCKSRLAELVGGHKPGDTLILPSLSGDEPCVLKDVRGLSDAVKAWISG